MDYIIADNFFENPNSIRKKALTEYKYYDKRNHPIGIGHFPGFRTLYLNDKKKKLLENKYNRLVTYSSQIEHEPTDNFGSDINNGRLVLTMFLDVV